MSPFKLRVVRQKFDAFFRRRAGAAGHTAQQMSLARRFLDGVFSGAYKALGAIPLNAVIFAILAKFLWDAFVYLLDLADDVGEDAAMDEFDRVMTSPKVTTIYFTDSQGEVKTYTFKELQSKAGPSTDIRLTGRNIPGG